MILLIILFNYNNDSDLFQTIFAIQSLLENMDSLTIQNKSYLYYKGTFPLSHFSNVTPTTDNKVKINNDVIDEQDNSKIGINGPTQNMRGNSNSTNLFIPLDSNTTINYDNTFWTINISDWIAIVLGAIALVASLPSLVGLVIYHLYRPNIDILIVAPPSTNSEHNTHYEHNQEIMWSDLRFINIRNFTKRTFRIETKVATKEPLERTPNTVRLFPHSGLGKGFPFNEGFWTKTEPMDFPGGGGGMGLTFPYISESKENMITITVNPRINLSEFGFPSFYGEISLKPIEAIFRIVIH